MALIPYEILIRFDENGAFKGAHTIRRDSDTGQLTKAVSIGTDKGVPWPEVAKDVNAATLEALSAKDNDLAQRDEKLKALAAVEAALSDSKLDDNAARKAVKDALREARRPEKEKRIAALEAELAKLKG